MVMSFSFYVYKLREGTLPFSSLDLLPGLEQCLGRNRISELSFMVMRSKAGHVEGVKCRSEQGHLGPTYTCFQGQMLGI